MYLQWQRHHMTEISYFQDHIKKENIHTIVQDEISKLIEVGFLRK